MAYTMLKSKIVDRNYGKDTLEGAALTFIRERCEGLRFDKTKATDPDAENLDHDGTSIKAKQIPYNMEKDIDRLCLENAIDRFLKSGKKEDAFDVYFCYLEMFVGDYQKTRRMIELLSEYEENGSGLLMKHRDHYSHSVYVFILGLAIYESNKIYRDTYNEEYGIKDEKEAACHFLQYWGLASLFHDIGYPFELPFEQVASYFEVVGDKREDRPFIAYHGLNAFTKLNKQTQRRLGEAYQLGTDKMLSSTDELFAYALYQKLGERYYFSEKEMLDYLTSKPTEPNRFGHYMDHAYFSATVLFKKLFEEVKLDFEKSWSISNCVDSLTAIILHNSLYKFSVAFYKNPDANIRLKVENHPLAFLLMLCDELQCWDRVAYGRNTKLELHPMNCRFVFSEDTIKATYIFDKEEQAKIDRYKKEKETNKDAKLKAYSSYDRKKTIIRDDKTEETVTEFQEDIERIVDLSQIRLSVDSSIEAVDAKRKKGYLSESNFINLYTFASVLNGMWSHTEEWKTDKEQGGIEKFLSKEHIVEDLKKEFGELSLEYKLSNINQAKAFEKYLNRIGCFYTDKAVEFDTVKKFEKDELAIIGPLEHERWLQEHYDMGWSYISSAEIDQMVYQETGLTKEEIEKDEEKQKIFKAVKSAKRENLRKHWDMISGNGEGQVEVTEASAQTNYKRLGKAEQDKDTDPMECMLTMLRMFDGLRIYRLNFEKNDAK